MTIRYRFDEDWNCLLIKFAGEPDLGTFRAFLKAMRADKRIKPGYLRLSDLRGISGERDADLLRTFAEMMSERDREVPPSLSAIIVAADIDFGMSRLYISNLEFAQEKYAVFKDLKEARAWLGLPDDGEDPYETGEWTTVAKS